MMPPQEINAWVLLLVSPATFFTYVGILLSGQGDSALVDSPYEPILLGAFGLTMVVALFTSFVTPRFSSEPQKRDVRDDEFERAGGYIGVAPVVVGGLAVLGMAMMEVHHFWIANVMYLSFVLAAVSSALTKIVAYRRGLGRW